MTDRNECEAYLEQISAMLDGELSADEQAELDEHLKTCASCREHLELMRYLIDATGETMVDAPAGLSDSVMAEIRAQGNVTPITKTNKILKFISGRTFTLVAAAVAAIVIFSPTILNNLSGFGAENASSMGAAAPTTAAMAYDIRPSTTAAATASQTKADAASVRGIDSVAGAGVPESFTITETGDEEYKYAAQSGIHHYNQLEILPDFSACKEAYGSVILLDTMQLQGETGLPDWLTEFVPNPTACGFFSYAFLSDEQVQELLTVTADGQSPRFIIPLHVLDDVDLYPALDPDAKNTLFVLMELSNE